MEACLHAVRLSHPELGCFDLEIGFSPFPLRRNLLGRDFFNLVQIGFRERQQALLRHAASMTLQSRAAARHGQLMAASDTIPAAPALSRLVVLISHSPLDSLNRLVVHGSRGVLPAQKTWPSR